MTTHILKTHPEHFHHVRSLVKTFEHRRDDRDYMLHDFLRLQEYDPKTKRYTGEEELRRITHLCRGGVIPDGYVVMSIVPTGMREEYQRKLTNTKRRLRLVEELLQVTRRDNQRSLETLCELILEHLQDDRKITEKVIQEIRA